MSVVFLHEARSEFLAAISYYESERPGLGEKFRNELDRTVRWLAGKFQIRRRAAFCLLNSAFANGALKMSSIREEVLRDPRYPVHRIANALLPYLSVLVEQFHAEQVILFGSYAYGEPDEHSDVDLLVVKEKQASGVKELAAILKAWRPIRWCGTSLPFELVIETPANHAVRASKEGTFYAEIVRSGLRLV